MRRSKVIAAACVTVFAFGVINLIRFSEKLFDSSENVRLVHVIGLSGAGVTSGAAIVGFIVALTRKRMPTEDQKPQEKATASP